MEQLPDTELLALIRRDSQQAFAVILHRYRHQLYKQIYRRIGDEEETKDVLQDIYISLWKQRNNIYIKDTFAPYLSKAAHYAIVDRYLFQKKSNTLKLALTHQQQYQWSAEDQLLAHDLERDLDRLLIKMPLKVQEVFKLSRKEGLSIKEISIKLGLSEQTVKNYLSTALHTFRKHLGESKLSYFLLITFLLR
ncbi:MAG: sigma-70 family RNA polymerase sigma factor [Sphingobacterium sp.]|jgi:RNA polymerase sigma-70 factor (ECF subfamily)|nr:sigma-70 family RNA polymerase sigma factor [Sphingobacterium sp.]